jgi:dihydroorotate dehydrogenase (NAD+) catalytic subunit
VTAAASRVPATRGRLGVSACGLAFGNPLVLAAGTAGYARELAGVMDLDRLGGIVTKAVSVAPGRAPPRRAWPSSTAG